MTEKQNNQGIALTSVKVQASTCLKCCSGTLKDLWKKKTVSTNFNKLKQYCKEEWDRMSSQWRERLAVIQRLHFSFWGAHLHIANGMLRPDSLQLTMLESCQMHGFWATPCSLHAHMVIVKRYVHPKIKPFLLFVLDCDQDHNFQIN